MQPNKTEQARRALQSHAAPLSMRERRALILCNGKRDLEELSTLLGKDAAALVTHLHEAGYLSNAAAGLGSGPDASHRETARVSTPAYAGTPAPAPPILATGTRRSLVAAKLYLIGMLELQRDESAVTQRLQLQACQDPDAIVADLLAGVHCLQRIASTSLAERVRERLAEALPESYLPALQQLELVAARSSTS